ncbi:phosphotransferase enzyme family protein [Paenibacillus spongiae]|uniref:Aminoglycoside phosphotransferase family protein n=1 Tax=Paenibacillus spongiae TaxID=2909671 RepID=A0ABY5SK50_9BACL|nr:aminoglycoside phosphotransferase family protein [Paenibacillus spongiae]UVI33055.1 aminoglycoside phosphotransferase family protein [Paenibacillus spongiae]
MSVDQERRAADDPAVRADIFKHIQETFGIHIYGYTPNFIGWYNLKWIITTDAQQLFVKCYHPMRYRLSESRRRSRIGRSLFFQHLLHDEINVCPNVWSKDGEFIFKTESGHFYVIMEHFEGRPPIAGLLDTNTHYRLGKAAGSMHRVLSRFSLDGEPWTPSIPAMKQQWAANYESALKQPVPNEKAIRYLEIQGQILSEMDLSFVNSLEPGWAHWDLWADNILIGTDDRVRFVDFDTVQFSYPEIDIARTLLSCALHRGELRGDAIHAYFCGYREERSFPRGQFLLALKLLWCKEAGWWLKAEMDKFSGPPSRFTEELCWLTDQWDELEYLYGDL